MTYLKTHLKSSKLVNTLFLVVILFTMTNCGEDEIVINTTSDFETFIREEMEFQRIPTLSALIFKNDAVLYQGLYGQSDIEQDISLQPSHSFMLASISKTITATALVQLYDQGLFSLDDDINNHLPFTVAIPNQAKAITFRMLLTHTSGIADGNALDDQYYFGEDSPIALKDFLRNYLSTAGNLYDAADNFYNFSPGTQSEYSNVGNALIGLLVEEISNQEFNAYCKQHIFSPLGMESTFWRLDEALASENTVVRPYEWKNGGHSPLDHYTFTDYPNGGLRSTALDLSKFLTAFANNGVANGYQLLKSATVQEMLSLQIPALDSETGLHFFKLNATYNLWGHDGGEQGVSTIMAINPDTQVGVVLLANLEDVDLDTILIEAYRLGLSL